MSRATRSIIRMMAMVVVLEVAWQLKGWRTVLYLQDNLSSLSLGKGGGDMIIFVFAVLVAT